MRITTTEAEIHDGVKDVWVTATEEALKQIAKQCDDVLADASILAMIPNPAEAFRLMRNWAEITRLEIVMGMGS